MITEPRIGISFSLPRGLRLARIHARRLAAIGTLGLILLGAVSCKPPELSRGSVDGDEDLGPGGSTPPPVTDLKVRINEVMVNNESALADDDGEHSPWVELYNPTDETVDVSGVPLSDDLAEADKWSIPAVPAAKIAPHGFLVVFCDGDPKGQGGLHANFKLEPEFLQLILNEGADLFFYDASGLGVDRSAGRSPDGAEDLTELASPTPGAANSGPVPPPDAQFVRGDANGDGRVNVSDMTWLLAILFQSKPQPECRDRLDADDNGRVDITDALRIGDALYLNGPTISPPFPAAGHDPTDDDLTCPGD